MGNWFGLDSLKSVDDIITNVLYHPPAVNKELMYRITDRHNVKSLNVTKNHVSINVLEVRPESNVEIKKNLIIFSHGNATNNFLMFDYCNTLANALGILVCSYDYPQYGLSKGKLNEKSCCTALKIVIDHYVSLDFKITLVAQSIGTGVLIDYISKNDWTESIILISPYMSIPSVITNTTFIDCIIKQNRYDSITKIQKVKCKVKIFHGVNDEIINIYHAKMLYGNLRNKSIPPSWLPNCGHNDILLKITAQDYINVIDD
tara:strand:+ start:5317 stop:6096 length:780 start_codon:yes stop_codon:yes gene_type:complete